MNRITYCLAALLVSAQPALAHFDVPGLDSNGQCVGDADSNHQVAINELVQAVNNALGGCADIPITLNFRAMVGDQEFGCGTTFNGLGTGDSQFIPSDFRFYLSNIRLVTMGGEEVPLTLEQDGVWQYQNVALLDFETGAANGCNEGNTATNTAVRGTVPSGVYTSVKFDLGLPFDLNHGDVSTAPSPLNFTAMFWSWNSGYKFLRIDTADDKFRVHLGSTGCNGGSASRPPTECTRNNVPTVTLTAFNPSHSVIEANIGTLLANSNIDMNQENTPPGCMGDPTDQDCAPLFASLGLNFANGSPSPSTQSFFSIAEHHDDGPPHVEFEVASTADGGGALVAHPEFDVEEAVILPFSECLGGTGEECTGGTRLFSAVNPGINPLEESEPEEGVFKVADGTQITLEATAIDPALVIRLDDQIVDSVGDTLVLGTTPEFHADLETVLSLADGAESTGPFEAKFKLTTTNATYQSSAEVTIKFAPEEEHHEE